MKKLLAALLLVTFTAPGIVHAETQAQIQNRTKRILQSQAGISSGDVGYLLSVIGNPMIYATAAELLAAAPADGTVGYSLDTDVYYFRTAGSWVAISSLASMANGATITNAVDGTVVVTEGGEAWSWVVTNNLWTFTSTTGATFAFTPAITFTGDVTIGGGAGAITCGAAGCALQATDNSATGFAIGAVGKLGLLTIDTTDSADKVVISGTASTDALSIPVGETVLVEGMRAPIVATHLETIRFCGNGPDGATTTYMGPVLLDDTEADLAFGGAGCDALDNVTEGTADAPWHSAFAFKPVALVCVGVCTGGSAANDAIAFQLKDDTVAVASMACTTAALGGDGVPAQCTMRDSSPATVAANSQIDISITMTNDDCNDAGDDFECLLYVTF